MGSGNIVAAVEDVFGHRVSWVGFDLNNGPSSSTVSRYQGDFLEESWRGYHTSRVPSLETVTVVTNPPYNKAEAFVRACRKVYPNADMAFLLRLGFLASDDRLALYTDIGAPDVYVLPNRPSFTGGGTDSADYGWFVWPRRVRRTEGRLVVLDGTPKEIRCPRQPRETKRQSSVE